MAPLTGAAWAGGFNRSVMELTSVVDRCRVASQLCSFTVSRGVHVLDL